MTAPRALSRQPPLSRPVATVRRLALMALLALTALLPAARVTAADAATIGLEEIERGQRGYGLSVFAGGQRERFEVEVLGVLRNVSPDSSYIVARLTGQGLEESGVIQGMSGSPVYIDDRLAGAVAFSWSFSKEAVAGITPIADMRRLSGTAGAGGGAAGAGTRDRSPGAGPPVSLARLAAVDLPEDLLERQIGRLRPTLAGGARSAVMWTSAGFGPVAGGLLERSLGAVGSGGAGPGAVGAAAAGTVGEAGGGTPEEEPLAPGSPVGAVLVDGDLRLAAVGTVTDRRGDELFAFGHSFLGFGPVAVPMAEAEVITVVSSFDTSFKLTNLGPVVGAFEQDRRQGIRGTVGREAPTIPLVMRVRSEDGTSREFEMRLADLPQITPAMLATSVLGGLEAASYRAGLQGLDLRVSFLLEDHGVVRLDQSFDGASAGVDSASYLLALAAFLLQNELEDVRLEGVGIELEQTPTPRTANLVGAHSERTVVRPGETVRLNVDLVAYRGEPFRHTLELKIPEDLPAGRYSLLVGDGSSVDVARLAVESVQPVSFSQALKLLRSFHSRRELVVLGVFAGQGLMVAGQPMPRLPGSVRSLWGAAPSGGAIPLRLAVAQQRVERLERPISGIVRVDLEVQHREPHVPQGGGGQEGEEVGEKGEGEGDVVSAPAEAEAPPAAAEGREEGR